MLKIGVILPSLDEKGPVIVAETIIHGLKNKYKFYVISLKKNKEKDISRLLKKNKNVELIELNMNIYNMFTIPNKLKIFFKENKINVMHCHGFWPSILSTNIKVKKITTLHNNPIEDYVMEYGSFLGKMMTYSSVWALNKYDTNIAISDYVANEYNKLGLKTTSKVIYNGIKDEYKKFKKREFCEDGNLNIISISVLNKRKNVIRIVDLFSSLVDKQIDLNKFNLDIIGDGPEKLLIEERISKANVPNVKMHGEKTREEALKLLSQSDVLYLTSVSEGFGLVIIEAMMMGKIVMVNNLDVFKEIISKSEDGFLCSSDNEFIFNTLGIVQDKKIAIRIGERARKKFMDNFSDLSMISSYDEIYSQL